MRQYQRILLLYLLLIPFIIKAQEDPENKLGNWLGATSSQKFSDKWSSFLQIELRTWEFASNFNEFLFRGALLYDLNPKLRLAAGYVRVDTWPFDENLDDPFFENRFYQELLIRTKWGKASATHRFRVEQRWITTTENGTQLDNRLRYMLNYKIPLKGDQIKPGGYYFQIFNEIFVDLNPTDFYYGYEARRVGLNQNRLSANIGKQLSSTSSLQVGFLWQHRPNGDFVRLVIGFSKNFNLMKPK